MIRFKKISQNGTVEFTGNHRMNAEAAFSFARYWLSVKEKKLKQIDIYWDTKKIASVYG